MIRLTFFSDGERDHAMLPCLVGRLLGVNVQPQTESWARLHQRGDERINAVAELRGDGLHPLARCRRDARVFAERKRHGGSMHSGTGRDVLQGGFGRHAPSHRRKRAAVENLVRGTGDRRQGLLFWHRNL